MRARLYGEGSFVVASTSGDGGALAGFDGRHHYHHIHVDGGSWTETNVTVVKPATETSPAEVIVREERVSGTVGGGIAKTWETSNPDGSKERGSTATDAAGNTSTSTSSVDAHGGVTVTTVTSDAAGNSRILVTAPDGSQTTTDVTKERGTTLIESVTTDAQGEVTRSERSASVHEGGLAGPYSTTTSATENGQTTVTTTSDSVGQQSEQTSVVDAQGNEVSSSRSVRTWDSGTRTWTTTTETRAADGTRSESTTTAAGDGSGSVTETKTFDDSGEQTSMSRSSTSADGEGNSSRTISSTDADGNVTVSTTTTDRDGNGTEHTTTYDSAGTQTSDTTHPVGSGGGSGSGDGGSGGSGDGGSGGGDDGPDSGDGGGESGMPAYEGDGGDERPSNPWQGPPTHAETVLGTLDQIARTPDGSGSGDDWGEGADRAALVRRALKAVVDAAALPQGEDGWGGAGSEEGPRIPHVEVEVPGHVYETDDWGDLDNPRALVSFVNEQAAMAAASASGASAAPQGAHAETIGP